MYIATHNQKSPQPAAQERPVETGFPCPAIDHLEESLNLQEYVVRHPASTFFVRVGENDHPGLGLHTGDLLVVDRSMAPRHNSLVITELNGEQKVCRLLVKNRTWLLEDGSGRFFEITFNDPFQTPVCGRVTHVIHPV